MANILSKDARIYVGGYDLGTVTLSLSIGRQVISVDSTVIVDPAERFVGGLTQDNITWDGIYDDTTSVDAMAAALIGSNADGTNGVIVLVGTGTGGRSFAGTALLTSFNYPMDKTDLVKMVSTWQPDQAWDVGLSFGEAASFTATGSSGTINNNFPATTSTTTAGIQAQIQVLNVVAGTVQIRIQESAGGTGAWADVVTFPVSTGGQESTVGTASGEIQSALRLRNSGTGTGTVVVVFKR